MVSATTPNSLTAMYCNIYLLGHPFCSRQSAPTTFLNAKIHTYLYFRHFEMQRDTQNTAQRVNRTKLDRGINQPLVYIVCELVKRCTHTEKAKCLPTKEHTASTIFVIISLGFLCVPRRSSRLSLASLLGSSFVSYTQVYTVFICVLFRCVFMLLEFLVWFTWPMSHGMWCGCESIDYFSLWICRSMLCTKI